MPKRIQTATWTQEQWERERAACRDRAARTSFHIYDSNDVLVAVFKKRASAYIYCNDNDGTRWVKVVKEDTNG